MELEALRVKIKLIFPTSDVPYLHRTLVKLPTEIGGSPGDIFGMTTLVRIQIVVLVAYRRSVT